jgi:hypothetical protein
LWEIISLLSNQRFFAFAYHLQIAQEMEQKRWDVKISLIQALRSFELSLQRKRKMAFIQIARVCFGGKL